MIRKLERERDERFPEDEDVTENAMKDVAKNATKDAEA